MYNKKAIKCYEQGLNFYQKGKLVDAEKAYKKAIKINPDFAEAYNNLGNILVDKKQYAQAVQSYKKSLRKFPDNPMLLNNIGNALQFLGENDDAIRWLKEAIDKDPSYADAYNNLGNAHKACEDFEKALGFYKKALQLDSGLIDVYSNIGDVFCALKNWQAAKECYEKATIFKPGSYEAFLNLAVMQNKLEDYEGVVSSCNKSIDIKPDNPAAYFYRGCSFQFLGRLDEALVSYEKAIELKMPFLAACRNRNFLLNYFSQCSVDDVYRKHLEYEKHLKLEVKRKKYKFNRESKSVLNVGYVSGDFRNHAVSYFFEPLAAAHDKGKFEIFCYYNDDIEDETTQRIKNYVNYWRDIYTMTDEQVVELVRNDNIDILVDLSGCTRGYRLPVFFCKPAPVQVTWLGYPNTTGLNAIDYRFTDEISDPPGQSDEVYTETLVRLPHGFLCFKGDDKISESECLPSNKKEYLTFGSFNNLNKVTDEVVALWSQLMASVPRSRLLLKSKVFASDKAKERYLLMFEKNGIDRSRLDLYSWLSDKDGHLRLYDEVDIALDTFPYNGTTTTCEALWMGVPVVTLAGDRHASRVGASILTQVGLGHYIANDEKSYIDIGVGLAQDKDILMELRTGLRQKMKSSYLCDSADFARNIESKYCEMWDKYIAEV
jgi:protein O-GlcNAc transferase